LGSWSFDGVYDASHLNLSMVSDVRRYAKAKLYNRIAK